MSCRICSVFLAAGVGIVATITWVAGDGNWVTAADWGPATVPEPSDDAANPGGSESVAGDLRNSSGAFLDNTGGGGTTLIIGGTLTDSNQLQVGNAAVFSATILSQRMLERRASCAKAPCATS
jgi:hypothetical protein